MEFETAVTIPWKTEEIRRRSWCGRRNFTLPASLTMRSVHPAPVDTSGSEGVAALP